MFGCKVPDLDLRFPVSEKRHSPQLSRPAFIVYTIKALKSYWICNRSSITTSADKLVLISCSSKEVITQNASSYHLIMELHGSLLGAIPCYTSNKYYCLANCTICQWTVFCQFTPTMSRGTFLLSAGLLHSFRCTQNVFLCPSSPHTETPSVTCNQGVLSVVVSRDVNGFVTQVFILCVGRSLLGSTMHQNVVWCVDIIYTSIQLLGY